MKENTPSTVKEFVVEASGGITQVLIGQPFDIVKVRMQTQANQSAVQVARNIWTHEGPRAFYKGTLPPLLGVGACISIVYSTFHTVSHAIQPNPNTPLTPSQTYLAGGLAGLANSLVSGPTEHIRIRLQTQTQTQSQCSHNNNASPHHKPTPNTVLACIRHIRAQNGIAGLYRGQTATMLREFGSYGVWFSVYGYLVSMLATASPSPAKPGKMEDSPSAWKVASCGAITGVVLWTVNYPFDVVKSKMQADGLESGRVYRGLSDVV
ncbi:mitochondrial carrier domain-containing protein [Aspergillus aurantiobrunneus]